MAFQVSKSDQSAIRIVTDFKKLNKEIERCHWPTESSGKLLRHIDSQAKNLSQLQLAELVYEVNYRTQGEQDQQCPNS